MQESKILAALKKFLIVLCFFILFFSCEKKEKVPVLSEPVQIVPSVTLPENVKVQQANNNLDIVKHDNRIFFAFRTAPNHFASSETVMYVLSSVDEDNWEFETEIKRGTDLREPRFLSFNGKLFLYFAVLGSNPLKFEPQGMMITEYKGHGNWTEPVWVYLPGFIPWRTKVVNGKAYMLGYVGGENIYQNDREAVDVHWLTTEDGYNLEPVVEGKPVVLSGGNSETDFVFLDDGSLVAVSRNEEGDELGWGSKICMAQSDSLGEWECVPDPKKYDSPLMFRHGKDIYLIGRRNLTETGNYDLFMRELPADQQTLYYEYDYWQNPKRCSLWRVNPATLNVSFVLDLPSKGDTCFAGLIQLSDDEYLIYNYTSPLDGEDLSWFDGQRGPTIIYRTVLKFQ